MEIQKNFIDMPVYGTIKVPSQYKKYKNLTYENKCKINQ